VLGDSTSRGLPYKIRLSLGRIVVVTITWRRVREMPL